jgi:hypothetical protein
MSSAATCPVCGFEWGAITAHEIPLRLKSATDAFVDVIVRAGSQASERPGPGRWLVLEYGAHLRDVLISIRERVITASVEDEPTGSPIHRDERVNLGFYGLDTSSDVQGELSAVSRLFVRTFRLLPPGFETREFVYSPVTPAKVTILWAGAQALHECEHHLSDVRENLTLL